MLYIVVREVVQPMFLVMRELIMDQEGLSVGKEVKCYKQNINVIKVVEIFCLHACFSIFSSLSFFCEDGNWAFTSMYNFMYGLHADSWVIPKTKIHITRKKRAIWIKTYQK